MRETRHLKIMLMCLMKFCMTRMEMSLGTEEDIGGGLQEIMERHMSKLRKRLAEYAALASIEDNEDGEEELKE